MQVVWCSITHGVTPGNLENIHQKNHENHNALRYPVSLTAPRAFTTQVRTLGHLQTYSSLSFSFGIGIIRAVNMNSTLPGRDTV